MASINLPALISTIGARCNAVSRMAPILRLSEDDDIGNVIELTVAMVMVDDVVMVDVDVPTTS